MQKSQTQRVLDRFGSKAAFMEATGIPDQTVRNWIRAGTIPHKYHVQILLDARDAGAELSPVDFSAHLVDALISEATAASS